VSAVTRPFRLDRPAGHFVVGDELPGHAPTWLWLHGLGSARAGEKSSSLLAHAQTRGERFLRVDLRGHGESSGHVGAVPLSHVIDDLVQLLDQNGDTIVVGTSLGGLVGAYAAALRPSRVRALALVAPALGLMSNLPALLDRDGCLTTSNGIRFPVLADVLADALGLDERGLPQRLSAPTLMVHGTADEVIPHRASERFFAAIPHARKQLWLVPDGNHRLNVVAPAIWPRIDALLAGA
jgi:pimeloyl-ACP methyl ester carboxylesterase